MRWTTNGVIWMMQYQIKTGITQFQERYPAYTSHDFPSCDILDIAAERTIDTYDQIKQLISSILVDFKTDSSSFYEYRIYYPTETSLYSLNFLNKIHFEDINKLSDFLIEHSDIIYDVLLGCQIATEIFDEKTPFNLFVENDDEMDIQYLVLSIQQKKFEPSVLEKIDKISHSYSENIIDKSTYFIVTADFQ